MAPNSRSERHFNQTRRNAGSRKKTSNRGESKKYFGCGICKADHRLVRCKKFNKLNLAEKYKTTVKLHYCVNCLARNHLITDCTSKARCSKCGGKHHSILHGPERILKSFSSDNLSDQRSKQKPVPIPAPRRSLVSSTVTDSTSVGLPTSLHKILVPTARVFAMTDDGCVSLRAILNPSSTSSHIAHSFVEKNKLTPFQLDGRKYLKLTLTPNMSSLTKYEIYLLVVRDLPKKPYTAPIKESIQEKFGNLVLADPHFFMDTPVEVELGGDIYSKILKSNIIRVDGGSLLAQDSSLGWLIMGSYSG